MSISDKLLIAIKEGDVSGFEALLEKLGRQNEKNKSGSLEYIMYHLSSDYISEKTHPHLLMFLSRLFAEGASPNSVKYNTGHPLSNIFHALKDDPKLCVSVTEMFIQNGLDLIGPEPAYAAVSCSLPGVIQKLLDAGYNPNIAYTSPVPSKNHYILNDAVAEMTDCIVSYLPLRHRAEEVIKVLLEAGANPNLSIGNNSDGDPPALNYCLEPSTAQLLLKYGADIDAQDYAGVSKLHRSIVDEDFDMANFLLTQGANPNLKDDEGRTPIFYVQDKDMLRLLIEHGAELNLCDVYGEMPLTRLNSDLIPTLIEAGADLDFKNRKGLTALHLLSRHAATMSSRSVEGIRLLIQKGADLNARDNCGMTPFLTLMLSHSSWETYIFPYMSKLAMFMVEHGADIYVKDSLGRSVFDIRSPIIDQLRELYEHIQVREQVLEEDTDTFAR